MPALVRHHPRQRGSKLRAKNSLPDFDFWQIKSFLLPHQPFPFILGFYKNRKYLQRIIDCCWRANVLWCANSEFGRRLGNPYQQKSFKADGKWAFAKFLFLLCLFNSARHKLLHRFRG